MSEKAVLKGVDELAVYGEGIPFGGVDRNDPDHHRGLIKLWLELGAKEPPSRVEMSAILLTLAADFPTMNFGHLTRATQLAPSGELDSFGDKDNLRMYGSPNLQFIVAVMAAFQGYRKTHKDTVEGVIRSMNGHLIDAPLITGKGAWEGLVDIFEKEKAMPIAWPKSMAYDYAIAEGLIEIELKEKNEIAAEVKARAAVKANPMLRAPKGPLPGIDMKKHAAINSELLKKAVSRIPDGDIVGPCKEEVLRRRLTSGKYQRSIEKKKDE